MKAKLLKTVVVFCGLLCGLPAMAQFDFMRAMSAISKVAQAVTISDAQMAAYVAEYVAYMDKQNNVAPANDPYSIRLAKLTSGLTDVEGIPLNFKVYKTKEANAFACADGSVRVFSSLMDIMSDDELLGVIGHEIGHVAHHDSKKGFKQALLSSALRDGLASSGGTVAALTDSQLGDLGEALASANYSQQQEKDADDYGYEFLRSHGKNPASMAMAFRRLKTLEGSNGGSGGPINQLFSTHPDLDDRIYRMESRAIKDGYSLNPSYTTKSTTKSLGSTSKNRTMTTRTKTSSSTPSKKLDHAPQNSRTSPEWTF
ncbi:MAG: M48 family metallopeptidase [Duncaniella sp.]|nr:M48 family metallopeptidase [Muribaculum sp.]MCM1255694.1 M48 family metallopeptidase [Duncaniella sp.]